MPFLLIYCLVGVDSGLPTVEESSTINTANSGDLEQEIIGNSEQTESSLGDLLEEINELDKMGFKGDDDDDVNQI